jgi:hypothetical protein
MKLTLSIAVALLGLSALPTASSALTISAEPGASCFSSDPTKCIGGVYSLDVTAVDSNTYIATYTMDLTSGLEIPATTIEQIEFKVAGAYQNLSVISAPDVTTNWSPVDGPLGGSGCKGVNGSFVCLDAVNPLAVSNTQYQWQVQFDAAGILPVSDWHIGARFASPDHPNGWILSASAPIPEARTSLLYAAGALLVGFALRRSAASSSPSC